jgi:hypothetical protein
VKLAEKDIAGGPYASCELSRAHPVCCPVCFLGAERHPTFRADALDKASRNTISKTLKRNKSIQEVLQVHHGCSGAEALTAEEAE